MPQYLIHYIHSTVAFHELSREYQTRYLSLSQSRSLCTSVKLLFPKGQWANCPKIIQNVSPNSQLPTLDRATILVPPIAFTTPLYSFHPRNSRCWVAINLFAKSKTFSVCCRCTRRVPAARAFCLLSEIGERWLSSAFICSHRARLELLYACVFIICQTNMKHAYQCIRVQDILEP